MRNPPILISVLGFFVGMAGFAWIFWALSLLGFDWFGALGDLPAFESVGLWGWFALLVGILWIAVAVGLWTLRPWAWMAAMIVAGIAVFQAFLWMVQFPGSGIGLSAIILPGIIVLYLLSGEVKAAFGLDRPAA
jgi:hypothetical protein